MYKRQLIDKWVLSKLQSLIQFVDEGRAEYRITETARAIKDLIPRYQTMKGKHVLRKAGWDTHGLPVELEVEKLLGLDGKEQIEQYGLYWESGEAQS